MHVMRPHIAVLGNIPGTTVYRSTEQYPNADRVQGILILRIDSPIFFANSSYLQERFAFYQYLPISQNLWRLEFKFVFWSLLGFEVKDEYILLLFWHGKTWGGVFQFLKGDKKALWSVKTLINFVIANLFNSLWFWGWQDN